jgi:hypothetical protein
MPLSLAFPNRFDAASLSGIGWTTGLPLAYLLTRQISQVARASTRRGRFYANFASPITAGVAALVGHNATTAARFRVSAYAADPRDPIDQLSTPTGMDLRFADEDAVFPGLTCARGSTATYFGADGLLKTAAVNTARVGYEFGTSRRVGLIVEGSATNRLLHCRDLTQSAWTKTNATTALTATGIDGAANVATRLTATGANARVTQALAGAGVTQLFSVFLRRVTGSGSVRITADNFGATTVVALTSSWQRFWIEGAASSQPGIQIDTSGDVIEVDFGQIEDLAAAGARPSYPILTTGAVATRQSETIELLLPASMRVALSAASYCYAGRVIKPASTSGVGVELFELGASGYSDSVGLGLENEAGANPRSYQLKYKVAGSVTGRLASTSNVTLNSTRKLSAAFGAGLVRGQQTGGGLTLNAAPPAASSATADRVRFVGQTGCSYEVQRLTAWATALSQSDLDLIVAIPSAIPATFDSGWLNVWPADFVAGSTAETRAGVRVAAMAGIAPAATASWWCVELSDDTNPAGYVELGRIFLGERWRPQYGALSGATLGYLDRATITEADSGAEYTVTRPLPRVAAVELVFRSESDAMTRGLEIQRQLGTTGELLFAWDDADSEFQPARTFLARLRTLQPITCLYRGHWRAEFEVKELL